MSTEEQFDSLFLNLAQQLSGGVPQLTDIFFSFLRRKTDFFTGGAKARALIDETYKKHEERALEDTRQKQKAEEERMKRMAERAAQEKAEREKEDSMPRVQEISEEEEKKILEEEEKKKKRALELKNNPEKAAKVEKEE